MVIDVKTAVPYSVFIENNVISRVGEIVQGLVKAGIKIMLVSETNVAPLYAQQVIKSLESKGFQVFEFIFTAGEESKTISTVCEIYEALAENGFTRSDIIITLGGGVAGDMGGFAAATYLRGINFVQVSTSLLSQVDASVGGKTGVDLPFGKNLVGAFHQPLAVITDPAVLNTLPKYYFNDGMGEVIKYGCISDLTLFEELEKGITTDDLQDVITRCIASKRDLVVDDTRDTGARMILNFGHTFGHALEKLHNFKDLAHGEAVGIGMLIVCELGEKLGITEKGTTERVKALLEKYGLPTTHEFTNEQLIEATALDKKSDGDTLNLILLTKIGESIIYKTDRTAISKIM